MAENAPAADRMTKARAIADDVLRFVREHRDLTKRQVQEFTARHGNPVDKARSVAKDLTPEEVRAKVRELNDEVERRLEGITKDLEKRYADLEREVEGAIERLFPKKETPAENGASATTNSP